MAIAVGESLAGNDSADASSMGFKGTGCRFVEDGSSLVKAARNDCFARASGIRSWGRAGPARLGTIWFRSSSTVSEYVGSSSPESWKRPCSFAYASTRATWAGSRPVIRR